MERTLSLAFDTWRIAAKRKMLFDELLAEHERRRSFEAVADGFAIWKRQVTLRLGESRFLEKQESRLVNKAWDQWRDTK